MRSSVLSDNDLLSLAAYENNINEVNRLLSRGVKPVISTYDEPLTLAAIEGHYDVVKLLVENGADVHARQEIAMRRCVENSNVREFDILMLLIDSGADCRILNDVVLRQACITSSGEVVKFLIDSGCDVRSWSRHSDGDLVGMAKKNKNHSVGVLKVLNEVL